MEKVNVVVTARGAGEDHVVGMEGGGRYRRAARLLQEGQVRLEARKLIAVQVEDLDLVGCRSAVVVVSKT